MYWLKDEYKSQLPIIDKLNCTCVCRCVVCVFVNYPVSYFFLPFSSVLTLHNPFSRGVRISRVFSRFGSHCHWLSTVSTWLGLMSSLYAHTVSFTHQTDNVVRTSNIYIIQSYQSSEISSSEKKLIRDCCNSQRFDKTFLLRLADIGQCYFVPWSHIAHYPFEMGDFMDSC